MVNTQLTSHKKSPPSNKYQYDNLAIDSSDQFAQATYKPKFLLTVQCDRALMSLFLNQKQFQNQLSLIAECLD